MPTVGQIVGFRENGRVRPAIILEVVDLTTATLKIFKPEGDIVSRAVSQGDGEFQWNYLM